MCQSPGVAGSLTLATGIGWRARARDPSFSESLREELGGEDIGVTVIHPGGVRTNIALSALINAGLNAEQVAAVRVVAEKPIRMDARDAATKIIHGLKRRKKRILVRRSP